MSFFSFVTRFLIMVFGVLLPARCTAKALGELELIDWAKYWIVYACLLFIELVGDTFFNWMPLYVEGKLLIVLWLVISAPQASVWIFDVILTPLLARHMPKLDDFLLHGKHHLLGDALNFTSEFCTRSLDAVMPVVSQIWKKSDKVQTSDSIEQLGLDGNFIKPIEHAELAAPGSFSKPLDNIYFDPHDADPYEVTFPSSQSQSQTMLSEQANCSTKQSMTELAKKVTGINPLIGRPKRNPYVYDKQQVDANQKDFQDDTLVGIEDLLKSERLSAERLQRPVPPRKERRRYQ